MPETYFDATDARATHCFYTSDARWPPVLRARSMDMLGLWWISDTGWFGKEHKGHSILEANNPPVHRLRSGAGEAWPLYDKSHRYHAYMESADVRWPPVQRWRTSDANGLLTGDPSAQDPWIPGASATVSERMDRFASFDSPSAPCATDPDNPDLFRMATVPYTLTLHIPQRFAMTSPFTGNTYDVQIYFSHRIWTLYSDGELHIPLRLYGIDQGSFVDGIRWEQGFPAAWLQPPGHPDPLVDPAYGVCSTGMYSVGGPPGVGSSVTMQWCHWTAERGWHHYLQYVSGTINCYETSTWPGTTPLEGFVVQWRRYISTGPSGAPHTYPGGLSFDWSLAPEDVQGAGGLWTAPPPVRVSPASGFPGYTGPVNYTDVRGAGTGDHVFSHYETGPIWNLPPEAFDTYTPPFNDCTPYWAGVKV